MENQASMIFGNDHNLEANLRILCAHFHPYVNRQTDDVGFFLLIIKRQ